MKDRRITLELTPAAARQSSLPAMIAPTGHRPLKRAIQRMVQDKLAVKILDGTVLHGDHVVVDATAKGGDLSFAVSAITLPPERATSA